jgi:homospermidine synthase
METIDAILQKAAPAFIDKSRFKNIMSSELYHYTNLKSFTNIIKTGTLWFTNAEYVNDLLKLSTLDKEYNELILNKNEKAVVIINNYKNIFDKMIAEIKERAYIISLCRDNNSMAMWRTYGKNGIVLEFNTEVFINYINTESPNIINRENNKRNIRSSVRLGEALGNS